MALPAWTLRRSGRSRRLSLTVRRDASVVVTAPPLATFAAAERFVAAHAAWIDRAVRRMLRHRADVVLPRDRRSYLANRSAARVLVRGLLARHAPLVGEPFNRVAIKDMTRNWGSCSEKRNLNFNYKLVLLPAHLAEYVVVHELCHLRHFNHSPDYWALVATHLPNHKALRKELRTYQP